MKYGYRKAERDFQGRYCVRALRAANLNVSRAAKIAGVHRSFFYDLMRLGRVKLADISPREVYRVKPYKVEADDFARRFLRRALIRAKYSPARAARLLGFDRTAVYRMAARLGVGLVRLRERSEGNAAWLALDCPEPDAHSQKADPAS